MGASINPDTLFDFCISLVKRHDVPETEAAILVESLVDANLKGVDTHGVTRLPIYLERVDEGLIDPSAEMSFEKSSSAAGILDANNGFGQVAGHRGMEKALELAKEHGVGAVGIRNSQHFGAAGYYSEMAAKEDFIGLTLTNSEPAMPPWGGYDAFFGTNPIALGVPVGTGDPILIDLSTSIVARGEIIAAAKQGDSIPEHWAVDSEGDATTDPEEALDGAVLTMAGPKGSALALIVDVLSGVLTGAGFAGRVGSMYDDFTRTANVGHFVLALNVNAFLEGERFFERIEALRGDIKSMDSRPDVKEVRLPGERRYRTQKEQKQEGIPLEDPVVRQLKDLAAEVETPPPPPIASEA